MHDWAGRAESVAKSLGDGPLLAAALAMPALAHAMTGSTATARHRRAEARSDGHRTVRRGAVAASDAPAWLAAAELYLDLYAEADAHCEPCPRAGSGDRARRSLRPVPAPAAGLVRAWQAAPRRPKLLDGAIEAGHLVGTPPALAGNLFNRSVVALAAGDLELALSNSGRRPSR
jgi:hypothetical protein